MSQQNITDLRRIMFDTLEALKSKDKPLDIERALAIKEVAQVIVNSAKVEIDFLKVSGGTGSGFIAGHPVSNPALPGTDYTERTGNGTKTVTHLPSGATVTRHRIGG